MINIKNVSSATVIISAPDMHFRRKLAPNRTVSASQEVYDELSYDTGFQKLVTCGFVKVDGLEPEVSMVIEPEKIVSTVDEIKEILEKRDITRFAKIIKDASNATKETIVQMAIEMRVTDAAFSALINKYCGINVIEAIAAQSEV